MKVLGLDLSTTSTGYCVYDNEKVNYGYIQYPKNKILTYGVIKPSKKQDAIDRIIYIEKEIKELIIAKEVEYVCIEELSSMRGASTTKVLATLQGHLEVELRKKEMLVTKCRPSEWRKCKVKGRTRQELKSSAIEYIKNKYNLEVNDDEADAICIAEYGSNLEIEEV